MLKQLPLDIENIIYDYKYMLEDKEKKIKLHEEFKKNYVYVYKNTNKTILYNVKKNKRIVYRFFNWKQRVYYTNVYYENKPCSYEDDFDFLHIMKELNLYKSWKFDKQYHIYNSLNRTNILGF